MEYVRTEETTGKTRMFHSTASPQPNWEVWANRACSPRRNNLEDKNVPFDRISPNPAPDYLLVLGETRQTYTINSKKTIILCPWTRSTHVNM